MTKNRVAELRIKNMLTQKELSEKINMNHSVLSRIETGERAIRDNELIDLASFFNVTTDYLLGRSSNPKLTSKDEKQINLDLTKLKEDITAGTLRMNLDGEDIDDEIKEYIINNMENALIMAKIKAKEKFTPKKYRK